MKTLSEVSWVQYGDQPFAFPRIQVKPRKETDPYSLKVESVGQWLILPVVLEDAKAFGNRTIAGWACVSPEGTDSWTIRYQCPEIFATKKKARAWAERYRLFPLDTMTPILEDPQDYVLQQ